MGMYKIIQNLTQLFGPEQGAKAVENGTKTLFGIFNQLQQLLVRYGDEVQK